MRAEYLECGKIINTHGVDGTLKLESWCDSPEVLAALDKLYLKNDNSEFIEKKVIMSSVHGRFVLAQFNDTAGIDAAIALKGRVVYAARTDITIEDGAYFIADLIGLDVIDVDDGKVYGKITDVINRGASDIYIIETDAGERMIPAVSEFVREIDICRGIFIKPIEGMF